MDEKNEFAKRIIRIRLGESLREKEVENAEREGAFKYISKRTIVEVLNLEGDARISYEYTIGNFESPVSEISCRLRATSKMNWEEMEVVAVDGDGSNLPVIPTSIDTPYQKTWQVLFPTLTRGSPNYIIKSVAKWQKLFPVEDGVQTWEELVGPGTLRICLQIMVPEDFVVYRWSAGKTNIRGIYEDLTSSLHVTSRMPEGGFVAELGVEGPQPEFSYIVRWQTMEEVS